MRIVETTISDKICQATALIDAHWLETAKNKHLMVLKPDRARYQMLEVVGSLMALVAYDGDKIIGYSVNIVDAHLHYADVVCAYNDLLFVAKEYRDTTLGMKLIRETERVAKERGAHLMLWHAKEDTALSKILPRMGCSVQEITYSKEL